MDHDDLAIYYAVGGGLVVAGTTCYLIGRQKQKKYERYSYSPLFLQDFQLGNTLLTADVNMMEDNVSHDKSLGMGLRFTF